MKTVRTVCVNLNPTTEQGEAMAATLEAFARACNRAMAACRTLKTSNRFAVHKAAYAAIRAELGLSANLTIRAIARACDAAKLTDNASFSPTSVSYDQRIFSLRESDWTFGLTTMTGRMRLQASLGEHQRQALSGQRPTSATLVRRGNSYYLHVQVKSVAPQALPCSDVLGVDFGIANIAVDSDGNRYSGKAVERCRRKHNLQRRRLQRRNTKGAKKKLKRVAGKEARFRRHENHVISNRIVESAQRTARCIALEDLQGIRGRVTARGGDARNRLSGWSFHQLRTFIEYKARLSGVTVFTVNPAYTSQACSACGHCERGNRTSQDKFHCQGCGHVSHADENAARNIRALGNSNLPTGLAG